ncbi:hypothetical protein KAR91_58690 [Candidatus Pacearchaeota archaeon]|nr:hypothetical protein [Candidatus Pacearchaeota archaeon]
MSSVKPPFGTKLDLTHPLLRDCVAWYDSNEKSGKFLNDGTNNKNLGTAINGPVWVGSPDGGALDFDPGSSQYIDNGTKLGDKLGNGVSELSVYIRFKTDDTVTDAGLFGIGDFASTEGEFAVVLLNDKIILRLSNRTFGRNIAFTDTTNYHDLLAMYTGANGYLYLDDVRVINNSHSTDINLDGLKTTIGAFYSTSKTLNGQILRCGIWNRVIQPFEVPLLSNLPDDIWLRDPIEQWSIQAALEYALKKNNSGSGALVHLKKNDNGSGINPVIKYNNDGVGVAINTSGS